MSIFFKPLFVAALAVGVVSTAVSQQSVDPRPVVYLTFDDGPSADHSTDELLDVLSRFGVTATFFVTGQRAEKEPDKISAILYGGHAIGNHTHSHVALVGETTSNIEREFTRANEAVLAAGGPPLTCYRPPFGLSDSEVARVGSSLGMAPVNWSVDTRDWQSDIDRYTITETLNEIADGAIVLMHDGPSKRAKTVAAVSEWLEVHAHEYRFEALPQCKPYGTSAVFAAVDEQEIELALEPEDIPSLLEKLRSYRFNLQIDGPEQERAALLYGDQLSSRVF
ncbi:MAG: polysaccharide deacetylase family protein [Pseudomonadota bacterium]